MQDEPQLTQVVFEIPPEENLGFPAEWVWAEQLGDGAFCLRNQPVYATGYAYRDIVEAAETESGLQVMRPRERSGYSALRVCPQDDETKTANVKTGLRELGGETYNSNIPSLFALIVAPDVVFDPILKRLEDEVEAQGEDEFDYEPIFISPQHAQEVCERRSDDTPDWIETYL